MAVNDNVPVVGEQFERTLASASPDLLRTMIREMAQRMMDAEVEGLCGAGYGEVSPERATPERVSASGVGHAGGHGRAGRAEAAYPASRPPNCRTFRPEYRPRNRRPY